MRQLEVQVCHANTWNSFQDKLVKPVGLTLYHAQTELNAVNCRPSSDSFSACDSNSLSRSKLQHCSSTMDERCDIMEATNKCKNSSFTGSDLCSLPYFVFATILTFINFWINSTYMIIIAFLILLATIISLLIVCKKLTRLYWDAP